MAKGAIKQAVKRLAIRGANELGKGAAVFAVGVGEDAAINPIHGGGRKRKKKHRKSIKGSKH